MSARKSDCLPFLDNVQVLHGPTNLLGRFFLAACDAAAEQGVSLSFTSLKELIAVNDENMRSWRPLGSAFVPEVGGINDENGFCIVGHNDKDEVVATQAIRLFNWENTNFKKEAESLRVFYADPDKSKAEGESCTVTAPSAVNITGRVGYGGAIWYSPEYRAGRLSTILPRIGRTYAFTRWNTDFIIAIMTERTVKSGFVERIGYAGAEWDITRMNPPSFKAETSNLRLGLASMTASQLIDDVFGFLISTDAQIDGVVEERRA